MKFKSWVEELIWRDAVLAALRAGCGSLTAAVTADNIIISYRERMTEMEEK